MVVWAGLGLGGLEESQGGGLAACFVSFGAVAVALLVIQALVSMRGASVLAWACLFTVASFFAWAWLFIWTLLSARAFLFIAACRFDIFLFTALFAIFVLFAAAGTVLPLAVTFTVDLELFSDPVLVPYFHAIYQLILVDMPLPGAVVAELTLALLPKPSLQTQVVRCGSLSVSIITNLPT